MAIHFFSEEIPFKLRNPAKTKQWLNLVLKAEKRTAEQISYIFCSDDHLASINLQYLNHNTFTDIITFDLSETSKKIIGEIYISIERVEENAEKLDIEFNEELHRVIVHGVLHLCGYKDKTADEKAKMRKRENAYLSLRTKTSST